MRYPHCLRWAIDLQSKLFTILRLRLFESYNNVTEVMKEYALHNTPTL